MSRAAFSLWSFAIYMGVLGIVLTFDPNALLAIFSIPETREVWIRVTGVLVLILAYYDFQAARSELTPFFRWSVHVRLPTIIVFASFVLAKWAPPLLILFGVVDSGAALWTALCLRRDSRSHAVADR